MGTKKYLNGAKKNWFVFFGGGMIGFFLLVFVVNAFVLYQTKLIFEYPTMFLVLCVFPINFCVIYLWIVKQEVDKVVRH